MAKLIVVTSRKGGVGKSTFGKLIIHTVLDKGLPLAVIDMDSGHPDIAQMTRMLSIDTITLNETDSYDRSEGAASDDTISDLVTIAVNKMLALPPEGIVLMNTPSNALDTLVRFEDILFPPNGEFYEPGHEMYAVYVYSRDDGDLYVSGTDVLSRMGVEHFITVVPAHMRVNPAKYLSLGLSPTRTRLVTMEKLLENAHKEYVAGADANFKQCGLNPAVPSHLTFLWWKKHYEMISDLFGLDAQSAGNNVNQLSAIKGTQDAPEGEPTNQVVNE